MDPMLLQQSIKAVAETRESAHFARPLYDTFGFAQLPHLLRSCWGGKPSFLHEELIKKLPHPPEVVVTILIDGFGWTFFERFAELPILARMEKEGVLAKCTTQFPSTTTAHITTFHSGAPVSTSGIWEWYYYEPLLDDIFSPFRFTIHRNDIIEPAPDGYETELFGQNTLYQEFLARGIRPHAYLSARYSESPYSRVAMAGAELCSFESIPEAFVTLREHMKAETGPAYHALYFDPVDKISHRHGPQSPHVEAEIRSLLTTFERELTREPLRPRTLFLLTADHGHIAVNPDETIYLDALVPRAQTWLQRNRRGQSLLPGGSPRDMMLYIQDTYLEEAHQTLSQTLDGRASVHLVSELLEEGLFGPQPGPQLRARLGNLLVLPLPHEMVWWRGSGPNPTQIHHRGHHGGLSTDEIEIPLLAWMPD